MKLTTRFNDELIEQYTASGHWPGKVLTDYLDEHAAAQPDKVAIIDDHRQVTYRELLDEVDRFALVLRDLGVGAGDVVSFQLPNWIEFVVAHAACTRIGAISNPLIPIFRDRELSFMVDFAKAAVLIVPSTYRKFDHVEMVDRLRPGWSNLRHVIVLDRSGQYDGPHQTWADLMATPREQDQQARAQLAQLRPDPNDVTLIMFTSGTTGEPKGVMHTHNTLCAANVPWPERLGVGLETVFHMASTCAHLTGMLYGARIFMHYGATVVLQEIWNNQRFVELIAQYGISCTAGATPFLLDLLDAPNLDQHDVSSLTRFCCMGAPIPPQVIRDAGVRMPSMKVMGGWGQTEDALVTIGSPDDPREKIEERDGRPWPGMEIRTLTLDRSGETAPMQEGALQVRGPFLFAGYLKREAATAEQFSHDGWFDTGDIAFIDNDGYLRISGRLKDVIIRGGENIPVAYVENTLYEHPDLAQVAVVGLPDPRLQEKACACVVMRPGAEPLTFDRMRDYLLDKGVARQYWPERLEVLPEFPATASGKIQKFRLRSMLIEHVQTQGV